MENKNDAGTAGSKLLLAILIAITAIGPASTQFLLPAMPAIQADFGTTTATVQIALSGAFFALAFSEWAYGPWSDRSGRRPVVVFGLALYLIGNAVCIVAPNVEILIAGRVVQACGGAVGLVLSRAIAVDVYGADKAASVVALTTAAMALAPLLAPTAGGLLTDHLGWRSTFVFQVAIGAVVLLAVVLRMSETNRSPSKNMDFLAMFRWFGKMMGDRAFAAYSLNAAFTMGVFFSFISGAPHVTQKLMGRDATEFGLWFMIVAAGYVVGNLTSAKIADRVGARRMVLIGSALGLTAIATMAAGLKFGGWAPLAMFLPGGFTALAAGLALPSAQVKAIGRFPEVAGTASALIGFLVLMGGAVMSQVVGMIQNATPYPMVAAMGGLSFLALAVLVLRPAEDGAA